MTLRALAYKLFDRSTKALLFNGTVEDVRRAEAHACGQASAYRHLPGHTSGHTAVNRTLAFRFEELVYPGNLSKPIINKWIYVWDSTANRMLMEVFCVDSSSRLYVRRRPTSFGSEGQVLWSPDAGFTEWSIKNGDLPIHDQLDAHITGRPCDHPPARYRAFLSPARLTDVAWKLFLAEEGPWKGIEKNFPAAMAGPGPYKFELIDPLAWARACKKHWFDPAFEYHLEWSQLEEMQAQLFVAGTFAKWNADGHAVSSELVVTPEEVIRHHFDEEKKRRLLLDQAATYFTQSCLDCPSFRLVEDSLWRDPKTLELSVLIANWSMFAENLTATLAGLSFLHKEVNKRDGFLKLKVAGVDISTFDALMKALSPEKARTARYRELDFTDIASSYLTLDSVSKTVTFVEGARAIVTGLALDLLPAYQIKNIGAARGSAESSNRYFCDRLDMLARYERLDKIGLTRKDLPTLKGVIRRGSPGDLAPHQERALKLLVWAEKSPRLARLFVASQFAERLTKSLGWVSAMVAAEQDLLGQKKSVGTALAMVSATASVAEVFVRYTQETRTFVFVSETAAKTIAKRLTIVGSVADIAQSAVQMSWSKQPRMFVGHSLKILGSLIFIAGACITALSGGLVALVVAILGAILSIVGEIMVLTGERTPYKQLARISSLGDHSSWWQGEVRWTKQTNPSISARSDVARIRELYSHCRLSFDGTSLNIGLGDILPSRISIILEYVGYNTPKRNYLFGAHLYVNSNQVRVVDPRLIHPQAGFWRFARGHPFAGLSPAHAQYSHIEHFNKALLDQLGGTYEMANLINVPAPFAQRMLKIDVFNGSSEAAVSSNDRRPLRIESNVAEWRAPGENKTALRQKVWAYVGFEMPEGAAHSLHGQTYMLNLLEPIEIWTATAVPWPECEGKNLSSSRHIFAW